MQLRHSAATLRIAAPCWRRSAAAAPRRPKGSLGHTQRREEKAFATSCAVHTQHQRRILLRQAQAIGQSPPIRFQPERQQTRRQTTVRGVESGVESAGKATTPQQQSRPRRPIRATSRISAASFGRRLRMEPGIAPTITLTDNEAKIVQLLESCCDWINANQPQPAAEEGGTTVSYEDGKLLEARLAGGWVRDKLLGLPSNDIDVSLSTMSGLNFAILFKQYLLDQPESSHAAASLGADGQNVRSEAAAAMSRVTKISANPAQSKNLETATARIMDFDVDFVNLRKDTYEGDSRIPTTVFGSAAEDADRRDMCINSLFYNVKARQVEDWTGKGLSDLAKGLIRTPLPPLTTFLDDPLRILRCVRFAARFNYNLDDIITTCLSGTSPSRRRYTRQELIAGDDRRFQGLDDDEVLKAGRKMLRDALIKKVSRERVGIEVNKIMSGPHPLLGHLLLRSLYLYSLVFHPDALSSTGSEPLSTFSTDEPVTILPQQACSVAVQASLVIDALSPAPFLNRATKAVQMPHSPLSDQEIPEIPEELCRVLKGREQRRLFYTAAALLAFRDAKCAEKKGFIWVGDKILISGLKLGRQATLTPVATLINSLRLLSDPASISVSSHSHLIRNLPDVDIPELALLGLLLQDPNVSQPEVNVSWTISLLFCLIHDLIGLKPQGVLPTSRWDEMVEPLDGSQVRYVIDSYTQFLAKVHSSGITRRLGEAPVLNGAELISLLGNPPPQLIPKVQVALLIFQFSYKLPDGKQALSDLSTKEMEQMKEAGSEWLRQLWESGRIVPIAEREAVAARTGPKGKGKTKGKGNKTGQVDQQKKVETVGGSATEAEGRAEKRQKSDEVESLPVQS